MTRSKHQRRQQREKKKQRYVPDVIQTYAKDKSHYKREKNFSNYLYVDSHEIHNLASTIFGKSGYISFEIYSDS